MQDDEDAQEADEAEGANRIDDSGEGDNRQRRKTPDFNVQPPKWDRVMETIRALGKRRKATGEDDS